MPTGARGGADDRASGPGTGGVIKARPEDFLVEELPLYEPCGEGEHLYLSIEKRNLSTAHLIGLVSRHFGVNRNAVGHAGLKDRYAVTRQTLSVHLPGRTGDESGALEHEKFSVLWADRHTNKLRPGHLAGNRFVIRIRDVEPSAAVRAERVLRRLEREGAPNRFGEQRFGMLANNHELGRALLLGRWSEALDLLLGPSERAPEAQRAAREAYARGDLQGALEATRHEQRSERSVLSALVRGLPVWRCVRSMGELEWRFHVTALQSALFNHVLDARIADGEPGIAGLGEGDLAVKHDNGAVFGVDGPTLADPETARRLASMEISPSGPLFGPQMPVPKGRAGEIERAVLEGAGLSVGSFASYDAKERWSRDMGRRRALRVPVRNADVEGGVDEHGPYVRCAFELPKGSFATVVMEEVIKPGDRAMSERAETPGEEEEQG